MPDIHLEEEIQRQKEEALARYQAQVWQQQQLANLNQQQKAINQAMSQAYNPYSSLRPQTPFDPDDEEVEPAKNKKSFVIQDLDIDATSSIIDKVLTTDIVPFLWGPPGIGKSTLVKDIAEARKWDIIDLRLSLLSPVDLRGLPVVDKINKQAQWFPPEFLPKTDTKTQGILFLDEINLAPPSVQAAAYQLILDKQVGNYKFPKTWRIIAAGNREVDRANVYKLSAPLANRFIHFNIVPNFGHWNNWAKQNGIRPEILDFLSGRPAFLLQPPKEEQKAFPSPRTWAFLSQLMTGFSYNEETGLSEQLKQIIVGTVGDGAGKEFIAHLNDYNIQKISVLIDQLTRTGDIKLPKQTSIRYGLIVAVFDGYVNNRIPEKHYKNFIDKLSGEEKKTIEVFEKDKGEDLKMKKMAQELSPNEDMPSSKILKEITSITDHFPVLDSRMFTGKYALIYDDIYVELIAIQGKSSTMLEDVKRGMYGTVARDWDYGAKIQPIQL